MSRNADLEFHALINGEKRGRKDGGCDRNLGVAFGHPWRNCIKKTVSRGRLLLYAMPYSYIYIVTDE
jgi:hypothetical protein